MKHLRCKDSPQDDWTGDGPPFSASGFRLQLITCLKDLNARKKKMKKKIVNVLVASKRHWR